MRPRRRFSAEFKAKVALEAIKGHPFHARHQLPRITQFAGQQPSPYREEPNGT